MPLPPVFSLSVHASYACRHSGACCKAGWAIPVEPRIRTLVGTDWLRPDASGACPQFDSSSSLCTIHRDHGETMLPESCHHFPRRALIDERGTFVTLSHFCPTAASLLVDDERPMTVVADPCAFPAERGYDGLDARSEWPPVLRPDALFDYDSFVLWEAFLVDVLSGSTGDVPGRLARIAGAAERLRTWTSAEGPLVEWTRATLADVQTVGRSTAEGAAALERYGRLLKPEAYLDATATVPAGLRAPAFPADYAAIDAALVAPVWDEKTSVIGRFLATKAFGSWTAYQSRGIRTQVAELCLSLAVLRVECVRTCGRSGRMLDRDALVDAVRASDWLLVHLIDRTALMARLGKVDVDAPRRRRG